MHRKYSSRRYRKNTCDSLLCKGFREIYFTKHLDTQQRIQKILQGLQVLSLKHTAQEVGDEPYLLSRKCTHTHILLSANRAQGLQYLLPRKPLCVLMDDGFQHRAVTPDISVILSAYPRPFYQDTLLPLGRLREHKSALQRADVFIFTQSPSYLSKKIRQELTQKVTDWTKKKTPVFFSSLLYASPVPFKGGTVEASPSIYLLTGIAYAQSLCECLSTHYNIIQHISLRDHFSYTRRNVTHLLSKMSGTNHVPSPSIFTTEKDYVKLLPLLQSYERFT